jgi:hypothetical protein
MAELYGMSIVVWRLIDLAHYRKTTLRLGNRLPELDDRKRGILEI